MRKTTGAKAVESSHRSYEWIAWTGAVVASLGIVDLMVSAWLGFTHAPPDGMFGWLLAATFAGLAVLWFSLPKDIRQNESEGNGRWGNGETAFMICLTASLMLTGYATVQILFIGNPPYWIGWVPAVNFGLGILAMILYGALWKRPKGWPV